MPRKPDRRVDEIYSLESSSVPLTLPCACFRSCPSTRMNPYPPREGIASPAFRREELLLTARLTLPRHRARRILADINRLLVEQLVKLSRLVPPQRAPTRRSIHANRELVSGSSRYFWITISGQDPDRRVEALPDHPRPSRLCDTGRAAGRKLGTR